MLFSDERVTEFATIYIFTARDFFHAHVIFRNKRVCSTNMVMIISDVGIAFGAENACRDWGWLIWSAVYGHPFLPYFLQKSSGDNAYWHWFHPPAIPSAQFQTGSAYRSDWSGERERNYVVVFGGHLSFLFGLKKPLYPY